MKSLSLLPIAIVASLAGAEAQALTISTVDDQINDVLPFWSEFTASVGQTFTLDTAATLRSVSLNYISLVGPIGFELSVVPWTGSAVGGDAFASLAGVSPFSGSVADPEPDETLTVDVGGVELTAGMFAVIFHWVSGVPVSEEFSQGSEAAIYFSGDSYAGGHSIWQNNGGDKSQWSSPWARGLCTNFGIVTGTCPSLASVNDDFSIELVFDEPVPVPVPAALPLSILSLTMLWGAGRRAKQASTR